MHPELKVRRRFLRGGALLLLGGLVVLVFGTGLLGYPVIQKTYLRWFCEECGLHKITQNWGGFSRTSLRPNSLSQWHAAHFPNHSDHVWHVQNSGTSQVWPPGGATVRGCSITPPLISEFDRYQADLDQRFAANPTACQAFIRTCLKDGAMPELLAEEPADSMPE